MLIANGLSTFSIKGNQCLVMVLQVHLKILLNVLFYAIEFLIIFTLAKELFVKTLWNFETCVLINNNLCRKSFSSLESPTTFE